MKKTMMLVFLLAASLCTVSVIAADVNISGEFDYGFITDGDNFSGEFGKIELDIDSNIDDYSIFSIEIADADGANLLDGDLPLSISYAEIATDWAAFLDLPIGLTTIAGYDGFGIGDEIGSTGWGLECYGGIWNDTEGGMKLDMTFADMITITTAYNFDFATDSSLDIILGAAANVEDLLLIVGYGFATGDLTAEAQYTLGLADDMVLDLAGSFYYDLIDGIAGSELFYGVGVGYSVAGATLGVSFNGNDADVFNQLGVDVNYAFTEELCIDAASIFDISSGAANPFLGVDVSASYSIGPVGYTLGYLYSDGSGAAAVYNGVASLDDGGVYGSIYVDF